MVILFLSIKKENSFAAELIGDKVTCDNITFSIADHENKNVIKCKGDTIQLPKEAAGKKLYILAASTDKDRKSTFLVNGKSHEFEIPYYSGFYGQWGHKGVSDGYIRTLRSLTSVLIDTLKKGMTPISTHICINWVSSFPKRHTHWYFLKMRISQYSLLLYPTTILTTLAQLMKCGHCHWKSLNDKITTL